MIQTGMNSMDMLAEDAQGIGCGCSWRMHMNNEDMTQYRQVKVKE